MGCYAKEWRARLGDLSRYQYFDQLARIMRGKLDDVPSKNLEGAGMDLQSVSDENIKCFQELVGSDPKNSNQALFGDAALIQSVIKQVNKDSDTGHLNDKEVGPGISFHQDGTKKSFTADEIASFPVVLSLLTSMTPPETTPVTEVPPPMRGRAGETLSEDDIQQLLATDPRLKELKAEAEQVENYSKILPLALGAVLVVGAFFLGMRRGKSSARPVREGIAPERLPFVTRALVRVRGMENFAMKGRIREAEAHVRYQKEVVGPAHDRVMTDLGVPNNIHPDMMGARVTAEARLQYLKDVRDGKIPVPVVESWTPAVTMVSLGTGVYQAYQGLQSKAQELQEQMKARAMELLKDSGLMPPEDAGKAGARTPAAAPATGK